jgi:integrase
LPAQEAEVRLNHSGPNELAATKHDSPVAILGMAQCPLQSECIPALAKVVGVDLSAANRDMPLSRPVYRALPGWRMPQRQSTARVYRSFLKNHILPKWGDTKIQAVQPRPVELWLRELHLSPKSKTHVRSLMHGLVEFAMWSGLLDINRNPISLVQNTGATRKVRKARSLTAEQFQALLKELHEPFATMALLCVCLGLRISEALALRWADVDWLDSKLSVQRGIVEQVVADVKTEGSARTFNLTSELLERLKSCKQRSDF